MIAWKGEGGSPCVCYDAVPFLVRGAVNQTCVVSLGARCEFFEKGFRVVLETSKVCVKFRAHKCLSEVVGSKTVIHSLDNESRCSQDTRTRTFGHQHRLHAELGNTSLADVLAVRLQRLLHNTALTAELLHNLLTASCIQLAIKHSI